MHKIDNPLWVEAYRPQKIADCVLPVDLKKTFQNFVDNETVPNLLLTGQPGTGKTTVARAMLEELGCDYIVINGSLEGRQIDTLRNEILQYATTMSIYSTGKRKVVIIDEADHLNPNTFQPALRNFMEEYSKNCGFILTCNYKHKIIEPLHSRCSVIEFKIPNEEKPVLAKELKKRVSAILDNEKVQYDSAVLSAVIAKFFPDYRRVINELQRYAATGKIDSGILANLKETNVKVLFGFMRDKEFTAIRKWAADNSDIDPTELYATLYEVATEYIMPGSLPTVIITLAEYQYKNSFAANPEINTVACLVAIMLQAEFKKQ